MPSTPIPQPPSHKAKPIILPSPIDPQPPAPPTGTTGDIQLRVKRLIPFRWFQWAAPYRDAVIGGLADVMGSLYSFVTYARLQIRLATVTGPWLDVFSYDYLRRFILRQGSADNVFRLVVQSTILQERVTRKGMSQVLTKLLNVAPFLFEPWSTNDAGGYNAYNCGYGVAGGWGSLLYPGQLFIKVTKSGAGAAGIPNVAGYFKGQGSIGLGGYGAGSIEYTSGTSALQGITDAIVYQAIQNTKPSGVTCWVQIGTENIIGVAPAVIPQGGIAPFLPIQQPEAQPHFIGKFAPVRFTPPSYAQLPPTRLN